MDNSSAMFLQRLSSLEDIMRRSEGNISQMLTRLKDVELAVSQLSKAQERSLPETRFLNDEVTRLQRYVTTVDQNWRQTYSDFSASLQHEIRGRIPQQVDIIQQQLKQENATVKAEMQEMQQLLRRVTDQWTSDSHDMRQVVQTTSWRVEQLQSNLTQQHQSVGALERRVEQTSTDLRAFATEVERNAGSFRQFVEAAVRAAHGDLLQRVELEQRGRDALQNDVQLVIQKLRDDVVRGLAHASATCKVLEENTTALETVLRAEVRSRIQKTDVLSQKLERFVDDIADDANSTAQVVRGLDEEGGAVASSLEEARIQINKIWEEVDRIKTKQMLMSSQRSSAAVSGSPVQQQTPRGATHTAGSESGSASVLLDMEEDPPSDSDPTTEGNVLQRVESLRKKVRSKASIAQMKRALDSLKKSNKLEVQLAFADMAEKMESDQHVLEDFLKTLKENLEVIDKKYAEQSGRVKKVEQQLQQLQTQPTATTTIRTTTRTVEYTPPSSPSSSRSGSPAADASPRSDKEEGPALVAVKISRPPSENPNVMKKI